MTKLEELKNEYSKVKEIYLKKEKSIEKELEELLQSLIDEPINVYINNYDYSDSINVNIDLYIANENGNDFFGSEIYLEFRDRYDYHNKCTKPAELKMNYGTIGTFSRKEAPDQIAKINLMAAIWKNEELIVETIKKFMMDERKVSNEAYEKFHNEELRIQEEELKQKRERAKKELYVGNKIAPGYCPITKITSKRVYFENGVFRTKEEVIEDIISKLQ